MPNKTINPNQLSVELLSICGVNPWHRHDSSSRLQMLGSHMGQRLVIAGATERYCQTGMEQEFGKYTLNVKMPVDARIIKVIDRYKETIDVNAIRENPQTIVIYENEHTKEIGMINLPRFSTNHQYMGFEYKAQPGINSLVPGQFVPKDTIFLDSPSITDTGGYKMGIELNMAFMSHPAVSEDGIMISSDVLEKLKFKTYETRVVEWGSKRFPLNMYGTKENFKAFPDIGEYIRNDGILVMLRSHDKNLAVVEQSVHDLMEPDFIFDKAVYVSGPGGKVVDIRVHHEENLISPTPVGMEAQILKYDKSRRVFHQEVLEEYRRLKRARGDTLVISGELHRLIVESLAVVDASTTQKISKLYRHAPLDDYRIEFVIEYEHIPTIGFKLTDFHGGK